MLDELILKTIKKSHKDSYYQELQNTINYKVIEQLFYLSTVKNQYIQVNAIIDFKIEEIKQHLINRKSLGTQKIYDLLMIKKIDNFEKNPKSFKKFLSPKIPDGSPIGNH